MKLKATGPLSKQVGEKIRSARKRSGLSQSELAGRLGITHQQVQKYEAGESGLLIERLAQIGVALSVDVIFFFEPGTNLDRSKLEAVDGADLFSTLT